MFILNRHVDARSCFWLEWWCMTCYECKTDFNQVLRKEVTISMYLPQKKFFFLSLGTWQCGPSPRCCHRREATVRSFSSLLPWLQNCLLACRPSLVKCWLTTKRTFRIICRCRLRFKATTALLARKVKARHAIIRRRVEPNTREQASAKDAGIALWILEVAYRKSYSNATNWMPEVWNRRIIG